MKAFRYAASILLVATLLATAPGHAQEDGEDTVEDPVVLTFDADTPALHIPVGRQSVEIVPAFEDYAFMLYDLCDGLGLTGDECLIFPMNGDLGGNAIATVVEGSPIIVYDRTLSEKAGYAGAMGIIAHELGHHRCGHLGTAPDPRKELAADRYAGAAMRRAGETLESALDLAAVLDDRPSRTHPGKAERVAALTEGWNDPEAARACALR